MTTDELHMTSLSEALVLATLAEADFLTIEQLVEELPELTWNQVFHILDELSRRDAILLRRRGFDYEVMTKPSSVLPHD